MNIFVYIHTISNTCVGCIRPKYIVLRKGYVQIKSSGTTYVVI